MDIGLDLDEVIIDICSMLVSSINTTFGTKHTIDVFKNYNFFANNYLDNEEGNIEVANALIKWAKDPEYMYKASPFPYSLNVINSFLDQGCRVHFITARPPNLADSTKAWLFKHAIPYDSLHVIGRKACKGAIGKELGLDIYVDDHPDNIEPILQNTKAKTFLVEKPWNKWYNNKKVTKLKNLSVLEEYL